MNVDGGSSPNVLTGFVRSLDRFGKLDADDRAAVFSLAFREGRHSAHHTLVHEGERPDDCSVLLDGYACRHKTAANGGRQIVSFHVPGDLLDVQHLELDRADHNVQAITPLTVARIAKCDMQRLVDERRSVRRAVWRSALVDASVFREWVLNVGRRDALSRVAHMLCEFATRREAAGLGPPIGSSCP